MKYKLICYDGNDHIIIETQANNLEELRINFKRYNKDRLKAEEDLEKLDLMFIVEGEPIIHNVNQEDF